MNPQSTLALIRDIVESGRRTWMQTYVGLPFDFCAIEPDLVNIEDAAHALANQVRWNGHTREPSSIAQHSLFVCDLVSSKLQFSEHSPPASYYKMAALIHDLPEAYIGDLPTPFKLYLNARSPGFLDIIEDLEYRILDAFVKRYQLPVMVSTLALGSAIIRGCDLESMLTEARDTMFPALGDAQNWWQRVAERTGLAPHTFVYEVLPASEAKRLFLERWYSLRAEVIRDAAAETKE